MFDKVTTIVLKIRTESMLVEKIYHVEKLLDLRCYPEYVFLTRYFIGEKRPKFIYVFEKFKALGWQITHQTMNGSLWLVTFEKEE